MASSTDMLETRKHTTMAQLRLLDRRAFVGFPETQIAPGIFVTDFGLQIPNVEFPFDVTYGAGRYQNQRLEFGFLDLFVEADVFHRHLSKLAERLTEFSDLSLAFRQGFIEGQARLNDVPLTFKVAFDSHSENLAIYFYDVRVYGFSTIPAVTLPLRLSQALMESALLPDAAPLGASGLTTRVLPKLALWAAVSRGFKMPSLRNARLSTCEVSHRGVLLRFASGGLPVSPTLDEGLLLTLEGTRAFSEAEEALIAGRWNEAKEIYLKSGDATDAHPFAAERLLGLLVADPRAHELALDVAQSLARRREKSAAPFWAEALVRERRGEFARSAERFLALSSLARRNHENFSAFFAAQAASNVALAHAPHLAVRALHDVLGLQPDHLPSLRALARAADEAKDRASAIRAFRRLAALARDPKEAADAHVQMARLGALSQDDLAQARLHCEAALRLEPDHKDALFLLAELSYRASEPMRAIKTLDRLRDVGLAQHDLQTVGKAHLLAGQVWDEGLSQPDNALLRFKEAASLLPTSPQPLLGVGQVAEKLGRLQEALAAYSQAVELAGPLPDDADTRQVAHKAHHALARLYKTRLSDGTRARQHFEAAWALDENDLIALDELIPFYRSQGQAQEWARACERAAFGTQDAQRKSALWAEAAEVFRTRLALPDKAWQLFESAILADATNRAAHEGLLALAEMRRDGPTLCRCLKVLSEMSSDDTQRVRYWRRLAVAARDLTFDFELATWALTNVLKVEPGDLSAWGELATLHRRRGDAHGLADALEQRARIAEVHGDTRMAAAALRELGQVLEIRLGRVGEALVALERSARLNPDAGVLMDLANLSLRCDRPQHAKKALEEALSVLPKHAGPARFAEAQAQLGRALELMGETEAAREYFALAYPQRPLDDALFGHLQQAYESSNLTRPLYELWAVRSQALLSVGRNLEASELWARCGLRLYKEGDFSTARLRLLSAVEATPHGEFAKDALEALCEIDLLRGEKHEAAQHLLRLSELEKDNRQAARVLMRAAKMVSPSPLEATLLQKALEKDASFAPALMQRAEWNVTVDPPRALADLETLLALPASDEDLPASSVRLELARKASYVALRAQKLELARKHLSFYVAARPDDVEAVSTLASLHRHADASEALCDVLGDLWPRLSGKAQKDAREEFADLCVRLGRKSAAMQVLREALRVDANDIEAARRLFELLPLEEATREERMSLLSTLVDRSALDEKAFWLEKRGRALLEGHRLKAAREDFQEAARLSNAPAALFRQVADIDAALGDAEAEIAAWNSALLHAPEWNDDAVSRFFILAQSASKAHLPELAEKALTAATQKQLSPEQHAFAYFALAQWAGARGDVAAQKQLLLEASTQGPLGKRAEALVIRAQLFENENEFAQAAVNFESALALTPHNKEALEGLKRNLANANDFVALVEVLRSELLHAPKSVALALYAQLGDIYLSQLKEFALAEEAFRKVATLDAQNAVARGQLARLLWARGEVEEAIHFVEETADLLPSDESASLLREGAGWASQHALWELSLKLQRRAHQCVPATGRDLYEFAHRLYLLGAVKEAFPLYERLSEIVSFEENPEEAEEVLLRLSELAAQEGQTGLAEIALKRLLEARPWHPAAVERLSILVHARSPREALEWQVNALLRKPLTERQVPTLLGLSQVALQQLSDVEMASRLLAEAAKVSPEDVTVREAQVALFQQAGRTHEWLSSLSTLASVHETHGHVDEALRVLAQLAQGAEEAGRFDEALHALVKLEALHEDAGTLETSANFAFRRAQILRDSLLDFDGAEEALEKAFRAQPRIEVAEAGRELALRRGLREAEMDWLERQFDVAASAEARAEVLVFLARLHLGLDSRNVSTQLEGLTVLGPDQAEAALKEALKLVPGHEDAEALLFALWAHVGHYVPMARRLEEKANTLAGTEKVEWLLKAAEVYQTKAGEPLLALEAMKAAHAEIPEDLALTRRLAEWLHQSGRHPEAAQYDALLLEQNPFDAVFERQKVFLAAARDFMALGRLLEKRAQATDGAQASDVLLAAADAFAQAQDTVKARALEERAFSLSPQNTEAFDRVLAFHQAQPLEQMDILRRRANAVEEEAPALLQRAAQFALSHGDARLQVEVLDAWLSVAPKNVDALEARAELASLSGGPRAAQPYDRRLLGLPEEAVPTALRSKILLRLGHASMDAGAYHDAAEVLAARVELDDSSDSGMEALSLLAEAYAHLDDNEGLYRTSLRLAGKVPAAEAESLFRRAANIFESPAKAIDAWLALADLQVLDSEILDKALEGLIALGRFNDAIERCEAFARTESSSKAAEYLWNAASWAQQALSNAEKTDALKEWACRLQPDSEKSLDFRVEKLRARGHSPELLDVLERLSETTADVVKRASCLLEWAQHASEAMPRRALMAIDSVLSTSEAAEKHAEAHAALQSLLAHWNEASSGPVTSDFALSAPVRLQVMNALVEHPQGAWVSAHLRKAHLRSEPAHAEGWSLLAKSFAVLGNNEWADSARAFSNALMGQKDDETEVSLHSVECELEDLPEAGEALFEVTADTMPHLAAFVENALSQMGLSGRLQPMLDVEGGVEAYLAAPYFLAIGTGALNVFGPHELNYLLALAVALGPEGQSLKKPGSVVGFAHAALEAFKAYPAPSAAAKVLSHLEDSVRGQNPMGVDAVSGVSKNRVFLALARHVLESFGV